MPHHSHDPLRPSTTSPSTPKKARGLWTRLALLPAIALLGFAAGCENAGDTHAAALSNEQDVASISARLEKLESKEEIRTILLAFSAVVDSSDPALLSDLAPYIADDFVLDAIDFSGAVHHFEGFEGVKNDFGPIMKDADANLMPSAIDVELDGDVAYASFKFANSVKPPPQLGLDVNAKLLLFAANNATLRRENGAWKLTSFELLHSLAYPGSL